MSGEARFGINIDNSNLKRQAQESINEFQRISNAAKNEAQKFGTGATSATAKMAEGIKAAIFVTEREITSLSRTIIDKRVLIKEIQADLEKARVNMVKSSGINKGPAIAEYAATKKALNEEKAALFGLQTQQQLAKVKVKELTQEYRIHQDALNKAANATRKLQSLLLKLGGIYALKQVGQQIIDVTGQFQMLNVAFRTILQSKEKADKVMAEIVQTAVTTPFQLTDLATGAKQLIAYGFSAEEVNGTLIKLGNVAAALGLPLERLTYLYGTTRTQGRLMARDMMQFTTSGIPLLDELAKMYGKSTQEINKMVSAGKIGFPEVEKAFNQMTGKGGKFFNLMQEQAKTIPGKISNLKDSITVMLNDIGSSQAGMIAGTVDAAGTLVRNYKTVGAVIEELLILYGIYKTAVMVAAALNGTLATSNFLLVRGFTAARTAVMALNAAMMANPYIAIGVVIASLAATIWILHDSTTAQEKAQKKLNETLEESNKKKTEVVNNTERLISKIRSETASVYEQITAWKELAKNYAFFAKYSPEQIRKMSEKELKQLMNYHIEGYDKTTSQTRVATAQKELATLRKQLKDALDDKVDNPKGGDAKIEALRKKIEAAKLFVLGLQKQIDETANSRSLARIGEQPVEEQVKYWEKEAENLKKQKELVEKSVMMNDSQKSKILDGVIGDEKSIQNSLNAKISLVQKRLDALRDKETEKNEAYWKKIRDDAAEARSLMGTDKEGSAEWKKQTDIINQAEKMLAKYSKKDLTNKLIDAQDTLNEKIRSANLSLLQSSIDVMYDGKAKELAVIKQKTSEQLAAIDKERSDLESLYRKSNKKITQIEIDAFDERKRNAEKAGNKDKVETEKKYAKEIEDVYRQLSGVFQTEEQKKRAEIEKTYREMLQWATKVYKGGGMSSLEFMSIGGEIERAKNRAMLADSLRKFATYQGKKEQIEKQYNEKIALLRKSGYEQEAKNAESARDTELFELEVSQKSFYKVLFGDLEKYSISEINKAIVDARALIDQYTSEAKKKGEDLTPDQLKKIDTLLDAINKGAEKPAERIKKIISAVNELSASGMSLGGVVGQISSVVSGLVSNLDNVFKIFDKKSSSTDILAAGISSLAGMFSMIGNQLAENKRKQDEWNAAIEEAAHQASLARIELEAYEEANLFGIENPYSKAIAGAKQYATSMAELYGAARKLEDGQVQVGTKKVTSGSNAAIGASSGAGVGAAIGSIIPGVGTLIGMVIGGIIGAITGLAVKKTVPVFESLKKKYGEIYDPETFELNPKILADYSKLDAETKKLVDNWKEIKEKALAAQEAMRENFKDLVGEMGTQLSDALIEAFKNGKIYDAIDDYKEYVSGAIGDIVAQLIFSAQFQEMFDELEKRFNDSFGTNGDMSIVDDMEWFLNNYQSQIDGYNEAMKAAQKAFKDKGIDLWSSDSTRTGTSKGIATASQDSIDETNGRLTTMQQHTYESNESLKFLVQSSVTMLKHLAGIETNTARLKNIEDGINSINDRGVKIR